MIFITGVVVLALVLLKVDLNLLEIACLVIAALVAFRHPRAWHRYFECIERWFGQVARHRGLAVLLVGTLTVLLRLAILPVAPVPEPVIVDEFSHRLLAETLLLGRASNPTHPMWSHLETIQVIQKPAYASMYFPGQGLFLALGKQLTGSMWAGVVLSVALMCMAVCWALQGWLPPGWALAGGLICVLRFGLFSYWINSYWGGAVGALGGALVIGAWPRIRQQRSLGPSLMMATGVALLAVSRPFEGVIVCVPVACAMLLFLARSKRPILRVTLRRVVAPILCMLVTTAGLLGYYNSRVTGSPARLPYVVNRQTYGWPLTLPWFPVEARTHSSKAMHDYFLWEAEEHGKLTHARENLISNMSDGMLLWTFFAGPALTVLLVFLPRALRDRRVRLPAFMVLAGLIAVTVEQSRYPHYFAPAMAAFLILLLQSARHMRAVGARRKPFVLAMVRFVPVIILATVIPRGAVPELRTRDSAMLHYLSWCCGRSGNLERARVVERLNQTPGKHLVIVRYGPAHKFMYEWVYNDADIDGSKIVWARDMGDEANRELMRYFAGRQVWILTVDEDSKGAELVREMSIGHSGDRLGTLKPKMHGQRPIGVRHLSKGDL